MTTTTPTKRAAAAGGYRGTPGRARYVAQLVALVTTVMRDRVKRLADQYGVSQAKILREVIGRGIASVERDLADGTLHPDTLA